MKILFICRGNVGRSQMAEAIFNNMMDGVLTSTSAGTLVENKDGEDRDGYLLKDTKGAENVIASMAEIGIDVSNHMRTQLTPEMIDECDWAVVMAEPETIPDYLSKSEKAIMWEVEDPKGMNLEETSEIRDQIESLVDSLITEFAL